MIKTREMRRLPGKQKIMREGKGMALGILSAIILITRINS